MKLYKALINSVEALILEDQMQIHYFSNYAILSRGLYIKLVPANWLNMIPITSIQNRSGEYYESFEVFAKSVGEDRIVPITDLDISNMPIYSDEFKTLDTCGIFRSVDGSHVYIKIKGDLNPFTSEDLYGLFAKMRRVEGLKTIYHLGDETGIGDLGSVTEDDPVMLKSYMDYFVGDAVTLRKEIGLVANSINTNNKRLTTLIDEKDKSVLSFFSNTSQNPVSVSPDISIDESRLILNSEQFIIDYDKLRKYKLEPHYVELIPDVINYLYASCNKLTNQANLIIYTELQKFNEGDVIEYLIGYLNPIITGTRTIEYVYIGDKDLKTGAFKIPPIPILPGERNKFISHRLRYYPNIGVRKSDGTIVQVGVNHISDQECEITWQGDLEGYVVIDY